MQSVLSSLLLEIRQNQILPQVTDVPVAIVSGQDEQITNMSVQWLMCVLLALCQTVELPMQEEDSALT